MNAHSRGKIQIEGMFPLMVVAGLIYHSHEEQVLF